VGKDTCHPAFHRILDPPRKLYLTKTHAPGVYKVTFLGVRTAKVGVSSSWDLDRPHRLEDRLRATPFGWIIRNDPYKASIREVPCQWRK